MKLWIITVIVLIIGLVVVTCGKITTDSDNKNEESKQEILSEPSEYQFDATILDMYEEYIMVEAVEGQDIVGEVRVQTGLLSKDTILGLKEGDTVRITHDGKMTMSIPPQMVAVELKEVIR